MPKRKRNLTVSNQKELNQLMTNAHTDTDEDDELSDRIQVLTDRRDNLGAGYEYIDKNSDSLRGKFNGTIRQVLTTIQNGIDRLTTEIGNLETLQAKRRNFANRVVNKRAKGGYAGDGNCYLSFVNVGMGDCTLVTSPTGVRIMIDCGSDSISDVILDPDWDPSTDPSAETYIQNNIKSKLFLNGRKKIDLLFLTHPDADHHDKLETLLDPLGITAGLVYYGGADKFTAFTSSAYVKRIAGTTSAVLRKVMVREESTKAKGAIVVSKTINGAQLPSEGTPDQPGDEFVDTTGDVVIYYEEENGSDFRISVIAGLVTGVWQGNKFVKSDCDIKTASEMKQNATVQNKGSLMILVQCFGETVLVCGDATAVTEQFAIDYFSAQLGAVEYLRMGHHGSPTSSSKAFVNALKKMHTAVASTGGATTVVHYLPKQRIIALYPPKVGGGAKGHPIYAFKGGDKKAQLYFDDLLDKVYATGSDDTFSFSIVDA